MDFNFYDIGTVMSTIEEIGLASDSINGTAVNVGTLTDQLIALGYNNKDIFDLMNVLKEVDGVSLIDINANVDTLAQSLSDLGLAAQDGVDINVNADGLSDLMSQLNFTREDTQNLITKLSDDFFQACYGFFKSESVFPLFGHMGIKVEGRFPEGLCKESFPLPE